MHSIERYGIVALLFLVVTICAVLLWDGEEAEPMVPAALPRTVAQPLQVAPGGEPERTALEAQGPDERAVLTADARPGPLASAPAGGGEDRPADPVESERLEVASASILAPVVTPEPERPRTEGSPARQEPKARTYAVRPGDTLSEIAQRQLGTSRRWKEIVALNPGLDPNRLRAGQALNMPSPDPGAVALEAASGPAAGTAKPAAAPATARTYRVAAGDSLWRIAQRTLGDGNRWREIAKLNPKVDPDRLTTGLVLVLPSGASGAPASSPRTQERRQEASPVVASRGSESPSPARRGRKVQ